MTVTTNDTDSDSDGTVDAATVDLDPSTPGQQTTIVVVSQGTFTTNGAGHVTFTPQSGFVGVSTVTYTVNDNDGATSNAANISVTVNNPPTALADSALTQLDTAVSFSVTDNDSDTGGHDNPTVVGFELDRGGCSGWTASQR